MRPHLRNDRNRLTTIPDHTSLRESSTQPPLQGLGQTSRSFVLDRAHISVNGMLKQRWQTTKGNHPGPSARRQSLRRAALKEIQGKTSFCPLRLRAINSRWHDYRPTFEPGESVLAVEWPPHENAGDMFRSSTRQQSKTVTPQSEANGANDLK